MQLEALAQYCLDNPSTHDHLPWRPDKWLRSKKISAMNTAQRGIYASMLFAMWEEPTCSIPDNTFDLACAARVPFSEFKAEWPVVSNAFFSYRSRIFNERLCLERVSLQKSKRSAPDVDRMVSSFNKTPARRAKQADSKTYGLQLDLLGLTENLEKIPVSDCEQMSSAGNVIQFPCETSDVKVDDYNADISTELEEDNREAIIPDSVNMPLALAILLRDRIVETGTEARITDSRVRSWSNDMRLMISRDKRTVDEIKTKIEEVFENDFWKSVIRSAGTLRKRWNEGKLDRLKERNAGRNSSSAGQNRRTASERERDRGHYDEGERQLKFL